MANKPKEGHVVHVELVSKDPAKSKAFYSKVFGWTFTDMPEMGYSTFKAPKAPHGGVRTPMTDQELPAVLNYIQVASVARSSKKIESAGGTIVTPRQEIPEVGYFAVFKGPDGVVQAVFEPK